MMKPPPFVEPADTLKHYFGYDTFRDGQQQVIDQLLEGQSAAAIFPTGSGKSLCYQLPALHLPHLTLVISPLLALMQDQLTFLQDKGIAAQKIDSAQSPQESKQVMSQVRAGTIKILMISVERLKNERFRQFIEQVPISLLVIDEAHCISEWGHNFRPDYLKLPQYRQDFAIPQTLLLTATATSNVINDMCEKFAIKPQNIAITGFYRPNLNLLVNGVRPQGKEPALLRWLSTKPNESTIVYVTLQQSAERVANILSKNGFAASAYHAGLSAENREQIQAGFMYGKFNIIVATIAFGMGIDKSDIRNVVHYDLPKSIENYSQEIGRAGRDGNPADCLVLASKDGLNVLQNFVYGDTPEKSAIESVLQNIKAADHEWKIQLLPLSNESDIRQLPLKTMLVYLEMLQVIRPLHVYFAEYRFKLQVEPETLLSQFEGERRQFVEALLTHSTQARVWWTVNVDTITDNYPTDRKRILSALEYFQENNWLELSSKQLTEVYEICEPHFDLNATCDKLHKLFFTKQDAEIHRIEQMLLMFESQRCLSKELATYFADNNLGDQCGHCSVCQGSPVKMEQLQPSQNLNNISFSHLCDEMLAKNNTLSNIQLTKILCGITSPLLTKIKAKQFKGFAQLQAYPFNQIHDWITQHRQ